MSSRGELTLSVWQICPPITAHKKVMQRCEHAESATMWEQTVSLLQVLLCVLGLV